MFELDLDSDGRGVLKIYLASYKYNNWWNEYYWEVGSDAAYQVSFTWTLSGSTITFANVEGEKPSDYTALLTTATVDSWYSEVELVLVSGDTPVTVTLN